MKITITMNQKILNQNPRLLEMISNKEITFLSDLDKTIRVIKDGRYKYFRIFRSEINFIKNFLINLDNNKIYLIIPFISINGRIDRPYIILSKQIVVTKYSDPVLIQSYINDKIIEAITDFGIDELQFYFTILKYKSIELDFYNYKKFN